MTSRSGQLDTGDAEPRAQAIQDLQHKLVGNKINRDTAFNFEWQKPVQVT